MTHTLPDKQARQAALDPSRSFIVQAPAGSGKTELLIQRFLVLLAHAEKSPEEIIAITFTRKAASEMRQRVLDALEAAKSPAPEEAHAKQTWALAQTALKRDQEKNWRLLENPHRLQIQTIDSLCTSLVRRMPLSAGFGSTPNTLEDPSECYLEAARRLLTTLENNAPYSASIAHLLTHLNNDVTILENLFVDMLWKRDQWLPYIMAPSDTASFREMLENSLKHIVLETLLKCDEAIPKQLHHDIVSLLQFAGYHLSLLDPGNRFASCKDLEYFPPPSVEQYRTWLAISTLLLTDGGEWRKAVNKNHGFPAEEKATKAKMMAVLNLLREKDHLKEYLASLQICPPEKYTATQWKITAALLEVLPILVAELNMVFGEKNVCDFTEVTLAALRALGELDAPSELALILDYQIRHLLIDEFQDTSTTQSRLLIHLTNGWENQDGRTLFLVGDPMQSIYRFREAEVGLFLKAQKEGIGNISLTPLFLSANFRSAPPVVNWINQHFTHIFPSHADISSGAVSYSPSSSTQTAAHSAGVHIHACLDEQQTSSIIDIIQQERSAHPENSIALLVRARTHLLEIIPALKSANIPFTAVEIEALNHQPIVHDLLALTTALIHLSDRAAWLAILRAPWCGLTLSDLYALAANNHHLPLWEILQNFNEISDLSVDGKIRLNKIILVLALSLQQRQRLTFSAWIRQTWKALNGPECLANEHEYAIADTFFAILDTLAVAGDLPDVVQLTQKINQKFATPQGSTHNALQIMTIHKAKGLEFDTVIIPYLDRKSRSESERLLRWLERPRAEGKNDLILAPIKAKDEKEDKIYRYLHLTETQKIRYEMARLLYVAATRAKKNLYLLAAIDGCDTKNPDKSSFLSLLSVAFEGEKPTHIPEHIYTDETNILAKKLHHRLPTHFIAATEIPPVIPVKAGTHPSIPPSTQRHLSWIPAFAGKTTFGGDPALSERKRRDESELERETRFMQHPLYKGSDYMQKNIGVITHRILQKISQTDITTWTIEKISTEQIIWRKWLLASGIEKIDLEGCIEKITRMITLTLNDARGRWILAQRKEQASELALTTVVSDKLTHLVIDRTFIDEQGIRWIIDYKTSHPAEGENIEDFLDKMQLAHDPQLRAYTDAVAQMDTHPIHLGLYFPAFSGWRAWATAPQNY